MSDQVFIFGALVIGTALAVVTTLLILRAAGLIKKAPAGAPPPLLNPLRARVPDLKLLPEAEQHRIARAAMRHPIVWGPVVALLLAFGWFALANTGGVLDLIESSTRMAGLVGVALAAVALVWGFAARNRVARDMVRRHLAARPGAKRE